MQFTVASGFNASAEIAASASYPHVRLFTADDTASNVTQTELLAVLQPWSVAGPKTIGGGNWTYFSAVCWFYGKELADTLEYPIGLIASSWGGTRDEAWMDPAARAVCNATAAANLDAGDALAGAAAADGGHEAGGEAYTASVEAIEVQKTMPWATAQQPAAVQGSVGPNAASALWNSMVVPFLRTAIYGAIWYQGEADCTGGYPVGNHFSSVNYACTFPSLVASWRKHWHAASRSSTSAVFPFGFMQLSTWTDKSNSTCGDGGSPSCDVGVVRWGQTGNVGTVPNSKMPATFMAVAVDLGDPASPFGDIHPRYKKEMAARLALSGRAVAYKDPQVPLVATTGPLATKAAAGAGDDSVPESALTGVDASAAASMVTMVTVTFKNVGSKALKIKHGVGFEVSGVACDYTFPYKVPKGTWVGAPILKSNKDTVSISTAALNGTAPMCVRYNWYNAACMPAIGPELCAIYGNAAFGSWLPAPPFILEV